MNNKPLISIIVPIYKVEEYLRQCVNSILSQTYTNLEIILVDDGSPDNSGIICDEYALKDSRIKTIHKQNGGLSDARNTAIDIAQGEYITFIDSDDTVTNDYIETLFNLAIKYDSKLTIALWQTYVEGTKPNIPHRNYEEYCWDPKEAVSIMYYQTKFDNAACVKLYHKSLFANIRFPKGLLFEDDYVVYRLLFASNKVAFCNKTIYHYLLRSDSIEGAPFSKKKMDSAIQLFNSMENEFQHLTNQVIPSYKCRYFSFCMHLILKAPKDYENTDILWNKICSYRYSVICNRKARLKSRIAALLSYFGISLLKQVFKLVDQRK